MYCMSVCVFNVQQFKISTLSHEIYIECIPSLQHLTINASIYTLVAVALDRYRGIMFPLKGGYSKFRAKMAAALIWALSITMAIPNLVVYHVST